MQEKTSHKNKSVSQKAKQGIFYTVIARLSGTFVQFFGSVILARTLAVEDFGLVQMGMMVIGFATKFGEFGFNMGLIQRKDDVREEHINTLFVMDFVFKLILFGIVIGIIPSLVSYFGEPRLMTVMPAIALYMVLDTLSNPGSTMLKRQMNFKKHAQIKVIERFIEIFSSVTLALLDFQAWSLIYSKLLAISVVAVLASRAAGWRPSLKFDLKASKELFNFGGWVFIRNLMRYMGDNVDYFFISRYLSTQSLGFYTRAFDLMRLPQRRITRAVNSVMFSAFARVQDQPEKVKTGFQKVVLAVSLVTYPILSSVMVIAPEFVLLVYGEKWLPMVLPLRIMCIAGILRSIDPFLNSVITATGYVKHTAFRRFIEFGLLAIATFIGINLGMKYENGIVGVAIAVAAVSVIVMLLMVSLLKRVSNLGWRDYLGPQLPAIGGSIAMVAAMLGLRYVLEGFEGRNTVFLLVSMIVAGISTYFIILWIFRPRRVVELLDEVSGDIQKLQRKYRKKVVNIFQRFGGFSS